MIAFRIKAEINPRLAGILRDVGPGTCRALYSVGANALKMEVRAHLRREAARRHATARRLGATPTGHLEKGAARVTSRSSATQGEVHVPIVGISRAFQDLTISPRHASALTIPVAAAAYGHRVRELERMGWNIFRPKGHDVLMGTHSEGEEPTALYALKKQVVVRRERTLLPSDARVGEVINKALYKAIEGMLK